MPLVTIASTLEPFKIFSNAFNSSEKKQFNKSVNAVKNLTRLADKLLKKNSKILIDNDQIVKEINENSSIQVITKAKNDKAIQELLNDLI